MPPYQVIAFGNRLEELANAADQRGSVASFSAAEFGIALGMPEDDAARIFAALEQEGWISYEHLATFYDRNRDSDDERDANAARKRRSRACTAALKVLQGLAARGRVDPAQRNAIEIRLALPPRMLPDGELFALVTQLKRAELSTGACHIVGHNVTPSDNGTVPAEQIRIRDLQARPVDNSGDGARGADEGLSREEVAGTEQDPQPGARRWIDREGHQLVAERMEVPLTRAAVLIARWLDQQLGGDACALAAILQAEEARGYIGARFHTDVTDAVMRHVRQVDAQRDTQGRLPLSGVRAVDKRSA